MNRLLTFFFFSFFFFRNSRTKYPTIFFLFLESTRINFAVLTSSDYELNFVACQNTKLQRNGCLMRHARITIIRSLVLSKAFAVSILDRSPCVHETIVHMGLIIMGLVTLREIKLNDVNEIEQSSRKYK